jgi:hypothetical protein
MGTEYGIAPTTPLNDDGVARNMKRAAVADV